jgi:hypothetical protein
MLPIVATEHGFITAVTDCKRIAELHQAFDSAILNPQPPGECCVSRVILEFRGVIVAPGENRRIEGLAPILLSL